MVALLPYCRTHRAIRITGPYTGEARRNLRPQAALLANDSVFGAASKRLRPRYSHTPGHADAPAAVNMRLALARYHSAERELAKSPDVAQAQRNARRALQALQALTEGAQKKMPPELNALFEGRELCDLMAFATHMRQNELAALANPSPFVAPASITDLIARLESMGTSGWPERVLAWRMHLLRALGDYLDHERAYALDAAVLPYLMTAITSTLAKLRPPPYDPDSGDPPRVRMNWQSEREMPIFCDTLAVAEHMLVLRQQELKQAP